MKMLVKIFVDPDHLVRVINLLTELGMTGFYLIEYHGMAPKTWKNFRLSEDPNMALKAVRDQSEPGIMVNTVIDYDKYCEIADGLEEALRGKRYTIIGHEIASIKVKGD
ncbi:MAG: MJ1244 family protein [Methanotrichaceae archaeon]